MKKLSLSIEEEAYLNAMASIGEAGKAILLAAKLNNVTVSKIISICTAMAEKYEREQ
jgi:hypothetical protein